MRNQILSLAGLLFVALFASCDSATGQTNPNDVHAEIMSEIQPRKTASNVTVGNKSVSACFESCDVQLTLNFCTGLQDPNSKGSAVIEFVGKERETLPADVFQLQPNEWVADLGNGEYIKIFAESGFAQMDIGGKFAVFMPDAGTAFAASKE